MSFIEVLNEIYNSKNFVNTYRFTDGKKFFEDEREFKSFNDLTKQYQLDKEGFDFSFVNLKNGYGRLIIEKRN